MSATIAIFTNYPEQIVDRAIPEIATRSDRPTLKLVKSVCDEIYAPFLRDYWRRLEEEKTKKYLLPRPRRTREEQARIDAMVDETMKIFGISEGRSA